MNSMKSIELFAGAGETALGDLPPAEKARGSYGRFIHVLTYQKFRRRAEAVFGKDRRRTADAG